jgi:hypothetical protein
MWRLPRGQQRGRDGAAERIRSGGQRPKQLMSASVHLRFSSSRDQADVRHRRWRYASDRFRQSGRRKQNILRGIMVTGGMTADRSRCACR